MSFPVWAFAHATRRRAAPSTVVFPTGFQVEVEAGAIPAPTTDSTGPGRSSGPASSPSRSTFFAYLVGDRPGRLRDREPRPTVARHAGPRSRSASWPDDAAWAKRVGGLVERGAAGPRRRDRPAVAARRRRSTVQEAVSRSTGGYAGLFDPSAGRVEIAYYADDFVVLHEAAHAWFNGALLADRWANEAFASYYGAGGRGRLKVKATGDDADRRRSRRRSDPAQRLGPGRAARRGRRRTTPTPPASRSRGRSPSGPAPDGLQAVWADAAGRVGAYQPRQPATPVEPSTAPPDWRGLLDLLEARTGKSFDDLWRTWVARTEDLPLLDAAGRGPDALRRRRRATAGDWRAAAADPRRDAGVAVRRRDDDARRGERRARPARPTSQAAARGAGSDAAGPLRTAFEDDDGFDDAVAEADAELADDRALQDAVAVRPTDGDPFLTLGLWDETPRPT